MLALLLQLQPGPAVGDTIALRQQVTVPPGAVARAADWPLTGDVELLGAPRVRQQGRTATVEYLVVAWRPGVHDLAMPGAQLWLADGSVDSLPAERRRVVVRSLLPAGRPKDQLVPQGSAGVLATRETSLAPPGLGVLAGLLLAAPLAWWWRRRGRDPGPAPVAPPAPLAPRRLLALGEARLALDLAVAQLAAREDAAAAALRAELEALRFAPAPGGELAALLERAEALAAEGAA